MKTIIRKTKPIIFQNNDFQTIQIKVFFPFKRDVENIAMMNLLPGMLHHQCSMYPTEREYSLQMQKLFILSCYCSSSTMIQDAYFSFNFMIPDVDSLGQDYLEEQFQFFSEMMYHPKTENNHFCQKEFLREVDNLKVEIDKAFKDCGTYAYIRAREVLDPEGEYSDTIYNHQEQIDQVTVQNLYQFYTDKILENDPLIYIFGNVDEKRMNDLCKKYFYRHSFSKKSFSVQTKRYLPIKKKFDDVVEKSSFHNSSYISFYKVRDMKEEDEIYLSAVQSLLSSQSSRILQKVLRTENDLVYSSTTMNSSSYGILGIITFIQKDNIQLVKEKIQDALDRLKDEDLVEECLNNIKERNRITLIRQLDDKVSLFTKTILKGNFFV